MFMKNNNDEYCSLYCECGCDNGVILKAEKDDFGCELTLVSDNFYFVGKTGWQIFKEKCKRILRIIRNKEHCYFSICIDDGDLKEFKEFVAKL